MTRLALAALAALAGAATAAEPLADTLRAKAPDVLAKLRKRDGVTAVGVLKFTADDGGKASDALNELGTTLAVRTHTALHFANTDPKFVVIENPNRQVVKARLREANHLTADGRKAFFNMKYVPSFGRDEVAAGAFVAGTARVSPDKSTLTLKLRAFGPDGRLDDLTDEWAVPLDADLLGEAGESYALPPITRQAVVSGRPVKAEEVQKLAADTAQKVAKADPTAVAANPVPNPALDDCPVKWEVRYNDRVQAVSGGLLPEPGEADKVTFVLTNPSTDQTYGVVLLVNGENTLYRERQVPVKCRKWVLKPRTETVVGGFQTAADTAAEFKVVRPDDPAADSVRYSENLGLFRLVVFAGGITDKEPAGPDGAAVDEVVAIATARLNDRPDGVRPQTLDDLKAALTRSGRDTTNSRGVVAAGKVGASKTQGVFFAPASEQPVADITLRYFHPKK